jgi:predicted secreted Zn-dependent protease
MIDMVVPVANRDILLDATDKCKDNMAAVVPSSLNVRTGPGAGRPDETLYPIQSYLQKNECVTAAATNASYTWVRISNAPRADAEGGWVAASFLKFDNDNLGPSLLPVANEPTPHPTTPRLSSSVVQPIGIEHLGNAEYVCYDIQGDSGAELALEMDRLGPYDSDGNKTWAVASLQFVINGGTCYSDGSVDFSDVSVSLSSTITMPCWYPPSGTNTNEISSFHNLMKLIAIHEIKHVEIAWRWATILEQQLRNANTCDQAALNTIYSQVWAAEEAAQDAFHASPEGQIIPYP